jgi:tRNA nucleotidyltransferase (CCA-adding enzyme)
VTLKTKSSELLYVSKVINSEPYETFKDDPLRVLRCFRFKARFDFDIHEDIYKALERQDIHESLRTKVSKERIGIEVSGMLKAKHPLSAFA